MILRITKAIGIGVLYLFTGILLLALFVLSLYLSDGILLGYPALGLTFIAAGTWFWYLHGRSLSTPGLVLRGVPVSIALVIALWAMIPVPQHDFSGAKADESFENWDLGDGRIAAVAQFHPPEEITPRGETIVFVHGGPGVFLRDFDIDFISGFTAKGFDVVMYDQVGAGRSSVVDITEYSHRGNVDDLKTILDRIGEPVILIGQSYGAGLITSYLADYKNEHEIRNIILTEPGPLPGADYSRSDGKTTKAENVDGVTITDVVTSPRVALAFLLPATNQFVQQEELLNYITPEFQRKAVAISYCAEHEDQMLPFEHFPVNLLATMIITDSFLDEKTPYLTDLDIPVLMLLGECSYVPRNFAMDYFKHYPIRRSHLIRNVGHILWATPDGRSLTYESIQSFINNTEPPLPNKPIYETRTQFLEDGL